MNERKFGDLNIGEGVIFPDTDKGLSERLDVLGKFYFHHMKQAIPDVDSPASMKQFLVNNYYTALKEHPGLGWDEYVHSLETSQEAYAAQQKAVSDKSDTEESTSPTLGFPGLDPALIRERLAKPYDGSSVN